MEILMASPPLPISIFFDLILKYLNKIKNNHDIVKYHDYFGK